MDAECNMVDAECNRKFVASLVELRSTERLLLVTGFNFRCLFLCLECNWHVMEVECLLFLFEYSIFFWLEYLLFGDLSLTLHKQYTV